MTDNDDTITMPKVIEGSSRYPARQSPVEHHQIAASLQNEIAAMYAVVAALEPLEKQARTRVLNWVRESLGITL